MALRLVAQENWTGCFIASVAMLLNKSYAEAFALLHPGVDMAQCYEHGFLDMSMEDTAHKHLRRLGFKSRTSKYKQFRSYRNRIQKNAILIIRWEFSPTRCHCIVFDAGEKKFIDPSGGFYIDNDQSIKRLSRQLDCGIVIEHIPTIEASNDLHRSPAVDPGPSGESNLRQDRLNPDEQVPLFT